MKLPNSVSPEMLKQLELGKIYTQKDFPAFKPTVDKSSVPDFRIKKK